MPSIARFCCLCGKQFAFKYSKKAFDNRRYCSKKCKSKDLYSISGLNTKKSIKNMTDTVKEQFENGRDVWNKGKKGLQKGRMGEKCNFWKGGRSLLTWKIKNNAKYRQWRDDIFQRDKFICQECGKNGAIEAHHLKAFAVILDEYRIESLESALICEELWNMNNGTTLCVGCHKKTDNYGNRKQDERRKI